MMKMQIGWNGFPTETETEPEDKVYVSAKNMNSQIEKGAHEKKCPLRSSLFGQAFLKLDAWFESTRGPNAKRRGGKVERKGKVEGNLSLVKVSFAERKVLGGEKKKMMNKKSLKSLKNDKQAVSPVIGVILMVAITVILAAVIGAFVFGLGPSAGEVTPQANLVTSNMVSTGFTLEHNGGDAVNLSQCKMFVAGSDITTSCEWNTSNLFEVGETEAITATIADGNLVTITHTPSQGVIYQTTARI